MTRPISLAEMLRPLPLSSFKPSLCMFDILKKARNDVEELTYVSPEHLAVDHGDRRGSFTAITYRNATQINMAGFFDKDGLTPCKNPRGKAKIKRIKKRQTAAFRLLWRTEEAKFNKIISREFERAFYARKEG